MAAKESCSCNIIVKSDCSTSWNLTTEEETSLEQTQKHGFINAIKANHIVLLSHEALMEAGLFLDST